jgi:hypothetical protein
MKQVGAGNGRCQNGNGTPLVHLLMCLTHNKPFCGIPGTSSNVTESFLEDMRPAHFEKAHGQCLLVALSIAGEQICHK